MENSCIIGIGSNIHPYENIYNAVKVLEERFEVLYCSAFSRTAPIGMCNQPDFLNGAVLIQTILNEEDVTTCLKRIEDLLGRDRSIPKYGPRTIDLDLVMWNGKIVDQDYYNRGFLKKSVDYLLHAQEYYSD
jgi:2-amino-4-hydroxy-6-hydroxymethyldihydropteridine diphosphokinase